MRTPGGVLRFLHTAARRLLLVLLSAWIFVVGLLVLGFGGPAVLFFYLWLFVVLWEIWLLVRGCLSLETYALIVLACLTGLTLLSRSVALRWIILVAPFLPTALAIWLILRKVRDRAAGPWPEPAAHGSRISLLEVIAMRFLPRFLRRRPAHVAPIPESAKVYLELRAQALAVRPEEIGVGTKLDQAVPYGILLEAHLEAGGFTLISFLSGDASIYFAGGGGVLGGVGHESVRRAARDFVASASEFLKEMERTTMFPLPAAGRTRFYVLTTGGIFTAEASTEDLGEGRHRLSPLFYKGNDVITELRKLYERGR
jgi:hypothetical protein